MVVVVVVFALHICDQISTEYICRTNWQDCACRNMRGPPTETCRLPLRGAGCSVHNLKSIYGSGCPSSVVGPWPTLALSLLRGPEGCKGAFTTSLSSRDPGRYGKKIRRQHVTNSMSYAWNSRTHWRCTKAEKVAVCISRASAAYCRTWKTYLHRPSSGGRLAWDFRSCFSQVA